MRSMLLMGLFVLFVSCSAERPTPLSPTYKASVALNTEVMADLRRSLPAPDTCHVEVKKGGDDWGMVIGCNFVDYEVYGWSGGRQESLLRLLCLEQGAWKYNREGVLVSVVVRRDARRMYTRMSSSSAIPIRYRVDGGDWLEALWAVVYPYQDQVSSRREYYESPRPDLIFSRVTRGVGGRGYFLWETNDWFDDNRSLAPRRKETPQFLSEIAFADKLLIEIPFTYVTYGQPDDPRQGHEVYTYRLGESDFPAALSQVLHQCASWPVE